MMFLHNHPSGGTFSSVDFETFCNNKSLYAMTAVGNDGKIYLLEKMAGFDESVALRYYYDLLVATDEKKGEKGKRTVAMRTLLKTAQFINLRYVEGGKISVRKNNL